MVTTSSFELEGCLHCSFVALPERNHFNWMELVRFLHVVAKMEYLIKRI